MSEKNAAAEATRDVLVFVAVVTCKKGHRMARQLRVIEKIVPDLPRLPRRKRQDRGNGS